MSGVLDPQGPIAFAERNLIVTAVLIMLIVAVPLLILLYTFAWKYRAGKKGAKYEPNDQHRPWKELIFWAIPAVIIIILSVLDWQSTHALDPSKALTSNAKPITIQVVALEWKWLFIYPQENIATVNFIQFPAGTPVHFELTADAPMSSFWIPQLGSQIYAMAAMQTQINLMASTTGEFAGKNTEINGEGFSGMTFVAKSTSQADFDAWVKEVQNSSSALTVDSYNTLAAPSQNNPPAFYSSVDKNLYGMILTKYMTQAIPEAPGLHGAAGATTGTMNMSPGAQMPAGMHM